MKRNIPAGKKAPRAIDSVPLAKTVGKRTAIYAYPSAERNELNQIRKEGYTSERRWQRKEVRLKQRPRISLTAWSDMITQQKMTEFQIKIPWHMSGVKFLWYTVTAMKWDHRGHQQRIWSHVPHTVSFHHDCVSCKSNSFTCTSCSVETEGLRWSIKSDKITNSCSIDNVFTGLAIQCEKSPQFKMEMEIIATEADDPMLRALESVLWQHWKMTVRRHNQPGWMQSSTTKCL